ncbi:PHP domain-containing protein [Marinihelvus fidelis]|uniref:PHP domain-containing protein n=1 Tax=Marinihelvus fidelis TaxID=2613842 RepID=A0A5N0T9F1_9GAMM|nr:PHP domain-containing protein [Marinihelvus fidelis]KAA9131358.1 PHP domain-containing protein [Marinihelvus fidelis]
MCPEYSVSDLSISSNIDLHSHTHCSDGALSPAALMARAVDNGVTTLAITDHDTVDAFDGLPAAPGSLQLVRGIEFSTTWGSVGIHVLGLDIDPGSPAILEGVSHQAAARERRAERIGANLAKLGVEGALEGAAHHAAGSNIGRPHFARHLVDAGITDSMETAFKKYLGDGKAGDVRESWASMSQVVDWIRAAGGIAVLAHPLAYKLTRTRLKRLLNDFIEAGGEGMEVVSGQQNEQQTRSLGQLCRDMGLLGSRGSDFHAPGQGWKELGAVAPMPERVSPVWERFRQPPA